jgi:hypothetical protein
MAVEIVAKYLAPDTIKKRSSVKKEDFNKSVYYSAPEIISSIALKLAQDILFIKDKNNSMDAELLKSITKYIEETFEQQSKNDVLKKLNVNNSGGEFNILKFYNDVRKDVEGSGFGGVDELVTPELEKKINLRDSVFESLKGTELDYYNQKSEEIQDYLDQLSDGEEGSINSILYNSFYEKQEAITEFLQEIQQWETRESEIRKLLKNKTMETLREMFEDEWAPRRVIIYFENRAYVGHFESFNYRRAADSMLISYDLKFVAEKQILGTLY